MPENTESPPTGSGSTTCSPKDYYEALDLAQRLYEMAHGREWDQGEAVKRYHTDAPTQMRTKAMAEMILRANANCGGSER